MTVDKQIEVPISKNKLILMILGSIIFIALGFWLIIVRPPVLFFNKADSAPIDLIVGIAGILFFGLCFVYIAKKLADNNPGLIINSDGITDNSSGVSAGLIPWKDINEITKETIANQDFLVIKVKNPEEYINRQTGLIKRKAMEMNYKSFGSPINISSNGLKCNFNELYQIINNSLHSSNDE